MYKIKCPYCNAIIRFGKWGSWKDFYPMCPICDGKIQYIDKKFAILRLIPQTLLIIICIVLLVLYYVFSLSIWIYLIVTIPSVVVLGYMSDRFFLNKLFKQYEVDKDKLQ